MRGPAPHTAEDATPAELWRASLRLLLSLVALVILVVPIVRELPLGQTTRTSVVAWLLVIVALYWLYAGLGYRALLLVQLALFSVAAALLGMKILLVGIGVNRLSVLRRLAWALIIVGAGCAVVNLGGMLIALARRRGRGASPT